MWKRPSYISASFPPSFPPLTCFCLTSPGQGRSVLKALKQAGGSEWAQPSETHLLSLSKPSKYKQHLCQVDRLVQNKGSIDLPLTKHVFHLESL